MTVLLRAFHAFGGSLKPIITLEGHGRESSDTRLDVSNTFGWFTVMYPFELPYTKEVSAHIQQVAAALIRVRNKVIGFGALYGYSNISRVTFNHLGKILTRNASNSGWTLESGLDDSWGQSRADCDRDANTAILDVTTWIQE